MDNLEEMDKFLEKHNWPRLNQKDIENINRPITSTEIETVIKNFPTNKSPGPDGLTGEFYQAIREELTLILLKLIQNKNQQGNTSFKWHIKQDGKLQANITDEHRCKYPQQNTSKQNPTEH